jgi:hypothetical protein
LLLLEVVAEVLWAVAVLEGIEHPQVLQGVEHQPNLHYYFHTVQATLLQLVRVAQRLEQIIVIVDQILYLQQSPLQVVVGVVMAMGVV